ncbi:MAG: hypothetical protein HC905_23010 [Bacteroidales bacterium]|nr:hypothetical protein [Bacteroidales bacterium]
MSIDSYMILRFEVLITLIIFILLVLKLNDADNKIRPFLMGVNIMLLINFLVGFIPMAEGNLFMGFFRSTGLLVLQKNILNLGLLLISLTSYNYLFNSRNRIEFYILMLSSMLGIYTMLSSGHILVLLSRVGDVDNTIGSFGEF